jgi:hypothetical protein
MGCVLSVLESPLLQKQPAQGSQVVQNPPAGGHVLTQFRQVDGDKPEGFLAASRTVSFRQCNVRIHVDSAFAPLSFMSAQMVLITVS